MSIEMSINEATQTMVDDSVFKTLARIFTTASTFRAVFVACTIMAISQLSGFNTLMYYSATLFKIVGFNNATAVAITVSATNFIFSLVNLVIVDKFGRRRILLVTVLGMSICLVIAAVSFSYIPIDLHTLAVQSDEIGWPGYVLIATIIIFVGFYSSGVATVVSNLPVQTACETHIDLTLQNLGMDWHRIDSDGGQGGWYDAQHSHMLEYQHHHRLNLPIHDERHHPVWSLRLLRRHLLFRLAFRYLLLPRG
jgi:hypothetical protein